MVMSKAAAAGLKQCKAQQGLTVLSLSVWLLSALVSGWSLTDEWHDFAVWLLIDPGIIKSDSWQAEKPAVVKNTSEKTADILYAKLT